MRINFKSKHLGIVGVVVIALAAIYFLGAPLIGSYLSVGSGNGSEDPTESIAKCLTEKGAVMYGAEWCSYCKKQKKMFGSAFEYVNYVECPNNPNLCSSNGVRAYPTWQINGKLYTGTRSLEELASMAGCPLS